MNRRKSITLAILIVLLLTFAVSGTIAYLTTKTGSVTNTFTPATPGVDVTDTVENNTKENVQIKNTSDFKAYIRVAVVANWYKDGKLVDTWNDYDGLGIDMSNWIKIGDYYYYKTPVDAQNGANDTVTLFTSYTAPARTDGAHLEMDIIAQSIQATPTDAVEEAWKVTVNGTTISKP